jgi:hypothetical protein
MDGVAGVDRRQRQAQADMALADADGPPNRTPVRSVTKRPVARSTISALGISGLKPQSKPREELADV